MRKAGFIVWGCFVLFLDVHVANAQQHPAHGQQGSPHRQHDTTVVLPHRKDGVKTNQVLRQSNKEHKRDSARHQKEEQGTWEHEGDSIHKNGNKRKGKPGPKMKE